MADDALFCVGQKAFIEKDGRVLVIRDPDMGIDFPGGKIQEGEAREGDAASLANSLKREVLEEKNLAIAVMDPFVVWYHEFPQGHRNAGKKVYLVGFACKYIAGELKLSSEHDLFDWVDKNTYATWDDGSAYFAALKKYFLKHDHGN